MVWLTEELRATLGKEDDPIIKAVRTSIACPSQWDATTASGAYLYLRFRHGYGSVHAWKDRETEAADKNWEPSETILATFDTSDGLDGYIELDDFLERAGLVMVLDAERVSYGQHFRDEMVKTAQDYPEEQREAIIKMGELFTGSEMDEYQ